MRRELQEKRMGWRMRRSVQVIPGVRLNFGKRGVSTTIGGRGLHTTFGRGRVTNTVGVPGTGISYSSTTRSAAAASASSSSSGSVVGLTICVLAFALAAVSLSNHAAAAFTVFLVVGIFFALPAAARVFRRLSGAQAAQEAAVAALRERAGVVYDKARLLLFLAREDGAVRANERDLIVRYLRSQPDSEDATDAWVKEFHAKSAREPVEAIEDAIARLGHVEAVDDELVLATEALVRLSKVPTPAQLAVLDALRRAQ